MAQEYVAWESDWRCLFKHQRLSRPYCGTSQLHSLPLFPIDPTPSVDCSPLRYTSRNEEASQLYQSFRHQACIIVAHGFGTTIFKVQIPD
jgi:hypothetical protein